MPEQLDELPFLLVTVGIEGQMRGVGGDVGLYGHVGPVFAAMTPAVAPKARRRMAVRGTLIATGIPFQGHGDFGDWTKIFAAIGPQVAGIRRFGAASLDLAWLAAGRFDGFWESDLNDWDTAAGCLIVREAGGFVSDFRGRSEPIHAAQVLAANDTLHSKLHKMQE